MDRAAPAAGRRAAVPRAGLPTGAPAWNSSFYAVLGLVGGLVSVGFVKLLLWQRKHFLRLPASTQWIQPAVGGLTVGLLGWFVPDVLGVGYGFVSQALNGADALGMMALLVLLKLVATATCYASGNAGGIFGPSLFIGAMLGGAVGGVAHLLLPDYTGSVGAYALVGMGAAFAGIVRVPLTSVIMIFEITRDYSIIVPLMICQPDQLFHLQPAAGGADLRSAAAPGRHPSAFGRARAGSAAHRGARFRAGLPNARGKRAH